MGWQCGKSGKMVGWHCRRGGNVMQWKFGKGGRVVSREGRMEFKDKIVLYWSREVFFSCSDHWNLPVVAWPVLRRVKNEEISYWQMVSCVSLACFQGRSGGYYGATGIAICVLLARVVSTPLKLWTDFTLINWLWFDWVTWRFSISSISTFVRIFQNLIFKKRIKQFDSYE